ncbi:MAG: hypothetical protein IJS15_03295 [Victivallales bacterium]|nr:hypothetical protein [Victivallales bacterium]
MEKYLLTDEFKKRIGDRRKALGAKMSEVAAYLKVDATTYWYWEKGVTRKCSNLWHERLRHFVESDISVVKHEMLEGKMQNSDNYELEDCLQVVSQVCHMVHEDDAVMNEYAQNVQKILMEAFTEELEGNGQR